MTIESKISRQFFFKPIVFFGVVMFVILCVCLTPDENGDYHFKVIMWLSLINTIIFGTIIFANFVNYKKVILTDTEIKLVSFAGNVTFAKKLSDITRFLWTNRPSTSKGRYGPAVVIKNEIIFLTFKDGSEFSINFAEHQNFEEIKSFLVKYCKQAGVLK